mmetsp:Transcript_21643/g.60425  ORF Transcript_21643/g.60425 Transcript_21643/m.60425 type:complete len:299 (-) Transcript_21643:57-953(-)
MIDSIGWNIGFVQELSSLQEHFAGSVVHQQKVEDLQSEFGAWRACRGDGNCFYRACGFALVEALLRRDPPSLRPVVDDMRKRARDDSDLFAFTAGLYALDPPMALEKFYKGLLTDAALDAELVRVMRLVSAGYLKEHEDAEFNGLPMKVYVEASHGMSIDEFCMSDILANGTEAESVALTLAPMALGLKIEIIQQNGSHSSAQRYIVPDGASGDITATLLFKPGHYDIIYPRTAAQEVLALQEAFALRETCQQKKQCPICMDETDAKPLACGCTYCEDCISSYRQSGATQCAVCKKNF